MQKNVVFLKTVAGLGMCTNIRFTGVTVIPNSTVADARREMTELCI
ncbi:hypothetical protein E2C01_089101 [Portunus trituberculatus]|uniref:Uncharacterized protein n=1 Tax=Portunus trituberculatus TaxID=210409 RepID=A0A5B7JHV3_PORTR|nr:hypothetical protein [Portunus trituberculatus]